MTPEGSPHVKGKKKPKLRKVVSAIHSAFVVAKEAKALGKYSKFGLLKFFLRGTADDKKAYFDREDEQAETMQSVNKYDA